MQATFDPFPTPGAILGDFIEFEFFGTGFDIGTEVSRTKGSEMFVCYVIAGTFDGVWNGTGEDCLVFQNEVSRTNRDVIRSVVGTATKYLYTVVVYNKDDGLSQLPEPTGSAVSFVPANPGD